VNDYTRGSRSRTETDEKESEQTDETLSCPECDGNVINDEEHGESVCADCGLVVEADSVDRGPEWRAFDSREKDEKSRVGAPTTNTMHDKGLSTNIDWRDKDAYGRSLGARQRQKMQRLRKWNERFRTRDSKERNLKQALGEIDRMASAQGPGQRPRDGLRYLPPRARRGSAPRSLYRGRLDLLRVRRRRPDGRRPAQPRRSPTCPASRRPRSPGRTATSSASSSSKK